ncbi:MAG TPA: LytTR family DNA-binding domain-containing protein, partial [Gemmatimonadaceae bacterium]|nr:LytTR family DNA-binding domain-containing protein [Gemmatimonadaceae bacterium]
FAPPRPLERIFARDRGRIVPIATRTIEHVEGCDDYVAIVAGGRRHLVNLRMNELESRLDPHRFVRVHRSHIVNLDYVAALVPFDGVRLAVEMRDGTRIRASRERSKALREMVR